jgi:chromate reductase, NAD(P)H dehydrogenase (quinone)
MFPDYLAMLKYRILAIIGSASTNSSNQSLVDYLQRFTDTTVSWDVLPSLALLPHFHPEQSVENTPQIILDLRARIEAAHGVLICTPEYIFSIPSALKNLIEWCVATIVFANKPVGLITASASGEKGHEELQLIMRTVGAMLTESTTLLIQGVKGKVSPDGVITDEETQKRLQLFAKNFLYTVEAAQENHD